jgi:hypothetical protein
MKSRFFCFCTVRKPPNDYDFAFDTTFVVFVLDG